MLERLELRQFRHRRKRLHAIHLHNVSYKGHRAYAIQGTDKIISDTNVNANPSSPYQFYNKECVDAPPTVISSSDSSAPTSSKVCGTHGYDKKTPQAFHYSDKAGETTLDGCTALCASKDTCLAFAYGDGACLLYTTVLAGNINAVSSSPYAFYDFDCVSTRPTATSQAAVETPTSTLASNCGVAGYDKRSPAAYLSSTKSTEYNLEGCAALCKSLTSCASSTLR